MRGIVVVPVPSLSSLDQESPFLAGLPPWRATPDIGISRLERPRHGRILGTKDMDRVGPRH